MGKRARTGALLLAGSLLALGNSVADAAPPASATHVVVTAGNTTTGVNGHLHRAASISGRVTSVAGGKALFASVWAYLGGTFVASGTSNGSGNYKIGGLAPGSYAVCVNGSSVFSGGGSTTGYLGRCYKTAVFNGNKVPSTATKVKVTAGQQKTGVNIALQSAGAVAGKVATGSGKALGSVNVFAHNRSSGATFFGFTATNGTYSIKGLTPASKGYTVCALASSSTPGATGFRPRCFKHTSWNGGAYPAGATKVSVSMGHTHTGVNIVLTAGGAISGKLTDAANGHPIASGAVLVYSAGGAFLTSVATNAQGVYRVKGLAAATGDRVCAPPFQATATVFYKGKCWKNSAWTGGKIPGSANPVSVKLGRTHTGINLKLGKTVRKLGSIAGKITESAGAQALQGAFVTAYTSAGASVGSDTTDASGNYKVVNLPASAKGYVICVTAQFVFSPTPPPTGWAPRCYQNSAWNGFGKVPAGANRVPLSAGQNKSGINIAVHTGGAISGTTTDAGTSNPVSSVTVDLYTVGGAFLTSTATDFSGSYSFTGLSPASYLVCFDGRNLFTGPTYRPQCYNGVAWNGS